MKTKKGKENTVALTNKSKNKNKMVSLEDKNIFFTKENRISNKISLEPNVFDISIAGLGQDYRGQGSVMGDSIKYGVKDSSKDFLGKKTKGNSTTQSSDMMHRDDQSKKGFLNRQEHDKILSTFRDEFSLINMESEEDFTYHRESGKHETIGILEIKENSHLERKKFKDKVTNYDQSIRETQEEPFDFPKVSTEKLFTEKSLSQYYTNNEPNNFSILHTSNKHINQNFMNYYKSIFDNLKVDTNKSCKSIESFLLNNTNDFHIQSNKHFLEALNKKFSEIFTLENQTINFIDHQLEKPNEIHNPFPILLKNINDFHNYDITKSKVFEIFENLTEKLDQNYEANKNSKYSKAENENNNNLLKKFFNNKFTYRRDTTGCFKIKYKRGRKFLNHYVNEKLSRFGLNKLDNNNNNENNLKSKDINNSHRKASQQLCLNEDSYNLTQDGHTPQNENNICLNSSQTNESVQNEESEIEDENNQNDKFLDEDFCLSGLNWKKLSNTKPNKLTLNKEIGEYMFESTEAPSNLKFDKEEFQFCENNQTFENKISINNKYKSNDNRNKGFTIISKFTEDKNINSQINDNFFFLPSQEKFIILDNIEQESKNSNQSNMVSNYFDNDTLSKNLDDIKPGNNSYLEDSLEIKENSIVKIKLKEDAVSLDPLNNQYLNDNLIEDVKENEIQGIGSDIIVSLDNSKENIDFQIDIENELELINSLSTYKMANNDKLFQIKEEKEGKDQINIFSDYNMNRKNHFNIDLSKRVQEKNKADKLQLTAPIQANREIHTDDIKDLYSISYSLGDQCLPENDKAEGERSNIIKIPKYDVDCSSIPQTSKEKNVNIGRDKLENLNRKEKLTYRNLVVKKIHYLKKKQKKNLDLKMLQDSDIIKSLIYMSNRKLSCKYNQKDKKLENSLLYISEKLERMEMKNIEIHVAKSFKEEVDNEIIGYLNIEDNNDCKIKQFSKLKTLLLNKSLDDNFSLSNFTNNFKNSLNLNKYFYQKNVNNCFKNKNNKNKENLNNEIFDLDDILNLRAAKDIQVSEDSKSLENASTIKIQKIEKLDNEGIYETNGDDFSNIKNLENGIKYFLHNLDNLSIISENIIQNDHNPLAYLDLLKIVYCLDNHNDNNDFNIFSHNFSRDNLIANNKKINSFIEKIVKYADKSRKYSTGNLKKLLNAGLKDTDRIRNPINLSEERTKKEKVKIFLDNFSEDNSFKKNKENTLSFKQDIKTKNKETKKIRTKNKKHSNIIEIPNCVSYETSNENKIKENSLEFKNNSNHNLNRSLITPPRKINSGALNDNENSGLKNLNLADKMTGKPFNEKKNSFIISKVRSEIKKTTIPNQGEICNKPTFKQNSNTNKTQNVIINIENNSDQKLNQESDIIPDFEIEKRNLFENENILVNLIEDNQDDKEGKNITQLQDNENERTCQKKYENIFNAIEELTDNESKIYNHVYPSNTHLSDSEAYQKNISNYKVDNSSNIHENNFIGESNSKKYNNIIKIDTGMFEILNIEKNDDKNTREKKRVNKVGRKKFTNLRKNGINDSIEPDIKISSYTNESKDLQVKLDNNKINNNYTINNGERNETRQNITKIPFKNLTSLTRESNENNEIRISFSNKNFSNYSSKNETKIINTIRPQSNESTFKSEEELPKHINISFPLKKLNLEINGLSKNHRTDSFDLDKNKINFKSETISKILDSNDSSKFINNPDKISQSKIELINKTKVNCLQEEKIIDLNTESQIIQNPYSSLLTKNLSNSSIFERFHSNHSINSKLETAAESINNKLKESIDKKENKSEKHNIFTLNKGVIQEKLKDKIEKMDSENFVSSIEKTKEDTNLKSYNRSNLSNQYSKESIFNNSENTTNLFNAFTKDLSNMKLNLNLNLNVNLNVNVKSKSENKKAYLQNEKEKTSRKRDLSNQMNQTSNSYVDMVNKSTSFSKIPIANNHTNIINNNTTNNFIINSPHGPLESNKILKYSVLSGFNSPNDIGTNFKTENKSEIKSNQMNNTLDLILKKKNYMESCSGINVPLNKNTGDQNFATKSMLGNKRYKESLISSPENQTLQQKLNIGLFGASSAALLENSSFKKSEKKEFAKCNFSYQNSNYLVKGDHNNKIFESGFINNIKKNNLDITEHFNSKIFNNSMLRNILTDKLKDLEENIILNNVNPELSVSKYNDKDIDNTHIKEEFQQKNFNLKKSILKEKEENENTKTVTDTCSDTEVDNAEIDEKNSTNILLNNLAILDEKKHFANTMLSFNNDINLNKNNIMDKNKKDNFLVSCNNNQNNDFQKNDSFNKFSSNVDGASYFGNSKKLFNSNTNSFNSRNLIGAPGENIFLANLIKNKDSSLIHKSDFKGISKDKKIENFKSSFKNKSVDTNKESPKLGFTDEEKSDVFITENNKIFSSISDNHMTPKIPYLNETTDNLGNTYRTNNIINNTLNNNFYRGTDNLKYIENQISAFNSSYENQNLKTSKTFSNDRNKGNNGDILGRNLYDILNFKGKYNTHSINKDINNLAFSNSEISNKKSINSETPNTKIDNIKFPYYENSRKNNFINIPNEPFHKIINNSNIMGTENKINVDVENPFLHKKHIPLFPNLNNTIQKNKDEDTNKNNSGFNLDDFFVKD